MEFALQKHRSFFCILSMSFVDLDFKFTVCLKYGIRKWIYLNSIRQKYQNIGNFNGEQVKSLMRVENSTFKCCACLLHLTIRVKTFTEGIGGRFLTRFTKRITNETLAQWIKLRR